jgi:hypothetical protein
LLSAQHERRPPSSAAGITRWADNWERSGGRMPVREFANQKAFIDHAERNGLVYLWEGMPAFARRQRMLSPMPAFTKRQQMLSPDQYEIVDVRTLRGVRRALLFSKAVLQAEFEANAPLRERMAIKRKQLRAKRPTKQTSPA